MRGAYDPGRSPPERGADSPGYARWPAAPARIVVIMTMTTAPVSRRAPATTGRLPALIVVWGILYGSLRTYWAAGHAPRFTPMPQDLMLLPGWGAVGLCAAAALTGLLLWLLPGRGPVEALGWAVSGVIVMCCPLVLLDIVGGVLAGLGIPVDTVSAASRAGMLAGAVLLAVATLAYRRRRRGACARCGRIGAVDHGTATPVWAWWAAYLAAAGCVIRIGAQLMSDMDLPYGNGAALWIFEGGFLLAGLLLPMALVHRFGRIWPRWVMPLAGRPVPRWLVLGPAFFVGVGLTVYFGFCLLELIVSLFTGPVAGAGDPYSDGFFWTAIPAYFVWGVGVLIATVARWRAGRPTCRRCGH
jgi:hypothetical protein